MRKKLNNNSNITIRGLRVKLLPTPEQESLFWKFAGTRRFAYNWALQRKTEAYLKDKTILNLSQLEHEFVLLKHNDPDKAWLKNISCDVGKQAIKDLFTAFDKYFDKIKDPRYKPYTDAKIRKAKTTGRPLSIYDRNGYPKFKKKFNCNEGFHQDCYHVQFKKDFVFIAKIGFVKLSKVGIFPEGRSGYDFKLYNPKVKTDGINWYFVAGIEIKNEINTVNKSDPIGIDLGVKDLAIISDGKKYKNINKTKRVKQLEKRKKRLQRKVSKKYEKNRKGAKYLKTNNSTRLQKKILRITKKLDGIRKNYRHQLTSEIVKREPIFICMEDLNVSGMMKNKHLSKAIQEQGFGYIRTYLSYKCKDRGIPLYFADRWYPSSKTCSCCGYINKELKLNDRIYNCPSCGKSIDRDINAAINLMNYGQDLYDKSIIQAQ